jgi:O-antigen ligase
MNLGRRSEFVRRPLLDGARLWFVLFVACQVAFLVNVGGLKAENTFGIIVAGALLTPFVLMALILWPSGVLLSVPLLVVVPGWVFGFTVFECVLLSVLLLALLQHMISGRPALIPSPLEWVFLVYVVWSAFTLFQAVNVREASVGLKIIVLLLAAFLAGRRLIATSRSSVFIRCIAMLAPLISLELAATLLRRGLPLSFLLTRSVALTDLGWGTSNYIAAVAALSTACAVPLAFYGRAWERCLGVLSIGAAVFVSIITISRGGTLAILVGLLVGAAVEARRRFFLAVGLLGVLASVYIMSPLGQASIARFVDPQQLPSIGARLLYYQETLRIIGEHRFFGVGPNQIPHHSTIEIDPNPHNFLLKNAADLGLPGLALYLLMLTLAFASAFKLIRQARERDERILALAFLLTLAIAVTNASYEPTLESSVYGTVFWMTVGTCYGGFRGREDQGGGK